MTLVLLDRVWADLTPRTDGDMRYTEAHAGWLHHVRERYAEPQRRYHTEEHVERLLNLCAEFKKRLNRVKVMNLAIVFHDIVYDPERSDNEDRSIDLFKEYASSVKLPDYELRAVIDFIKATERHDIPDDLRAELDPITLSDLEYFLDFDLEVLSWQDKDYDRYTEQIRQENAHFPEDVFRPGRIAVLRKLLARKGGLYYTADFKEHLEERARRNLKREMEQLE